MYGPNVEIMPNKVAQVNRSGGRAGLADFRPEIGLVLLLCAYCAALFLSLIQTADAFPGIITFRPSGAFAAALGSACFGLLAICFATAKFSFGYFLGFYFYTMIFGYVSFVRFSELSYDHRLAVVSIVLSCIAFLAPALFLTSPIKRTFEWPKRRFDLLPSLILLLAAAILAAGALHNFKPASFSEMYKFRGQTQLPAWLRYATGISVGALLPFAFACFVERKRYLQAAIALLALMLMYPVTLTKLTMFAAPWLLFLAVLSGMLAPRPAVILSLLLPLSLGLALPFLMQAGVVPTQLGLIFVGTVGSRMIALPAIALDAYNEFFARHVPTYFCQINLLKLVMACPYDEPLSIVMSKAYNLGNLNASLFATEGIASVGALWAPLSALACGVIIGFANRLSTGLPATFVIVSGGMLPHLLLNVPLSTSLLSNGAALLFLLWYITPRSVFAEQDEKPTPVP